MSKEVQVISGKVRSTFDDATKKQIVADSYASNLSLNQFAKKAGISPATLCQWRKQYKNQDCTFESIPGDSQGFEQIQRENQALKTEIFRIKAYLGHKMYELDAPKIAC